jgi:hypothetical protein
MSNSCWEKEICSGLLLYSIVIVLIHVRNPPIYMKLVRGFNESKIRKIMFLFLLVRS